MSLDGKIGKEDKRVRFSSERDKLRVHELRSEVDAVMVGVNTVLIDDPKLTAHYSKSKKNPVRVVIDSKARTPLEAKVLGQGAETIIAVSQKASSSRMEKLKKKGAKIVSLGEEQVNLRELLERLKGEGMKKVLLEGGGTLNKTMIQEGLVDEIYVTIAPTLLGKGINLIKGELNSPVGLKLEGITQFDDEVILHYTTRWKK